MIWTIRLIKHGNYFGIYIKIIVTSRFERHYIATWVMKWEYFMFIGHTQTAANGISPRRVNSSNICVPADYMLLLRREVRWSPTSSMWSLKCIEDGVFFNPFTHTADSESCCSPTHHASTIQHRRISRNSALALTIRGGWALQEPQVRCLPGTKHHARYLPRHWSGTALSRAQSHPLSNA